MASRTNKSVCLFCLGDLDNQRICTSCKKRADDTPSPPHHLPQRTVLADRYLMGKALGEGGFGITYYAWDLTNGEKVAVKEYFPVGSVVRVANNNVMINGTAQTAIANRGLKRFMDEARVLSKVSNLAGVVCIKNCFKANSTAYIVMEFLNGVSLKKYLQKKGGKIPMYEAMAILRPVMESLVDVHALQLIHRDISPDNMIIGKSGDVKLIDFGAAKQSNLEGRSLSIVLKQGFAPEEQYRTHGEQGPWTDIYALGATFYLCITGQLPPESIQRLHKDTIVKPSVLGAEITLAQETVLMRSLAVNAKNRYRDLKTMIKALYGNSVMQRITAPPQSVTIASTSTKNQRPITVLYDNNQKLANTSASATRSVKSEVLLEGAANKSIKPKKDTNKKETSKKKDTKKKDVKASKPVKAKDNKKKDTTKPKKSFFSSIKDFFKASDEKEEK